MRRIWLVSCIEVSVHILMVTVGSWCMMVLVKSKVTVCVVKLVVAVSKMVRTFIHDVVLLEMST